MIFVRLDGCAAPMGDESIRLAEGLVFERLKPPVGSSYGIFRL
jgi:hypothetical protein